MYRRLLLCSAWFLAATAFAADSPVGKFLLNDDFEANAPGTHPAGWGVLTDKGNDAVVVDSPALGKRSVRFTDTGGTVWKPMIQGGISGEPGSFLKLDFDWRLHGTVDDFAKALTITLRGPGNLEVATVALGGPGGAAVRQKGLDWVPLRVPLKTDQWNHLTLIADPISRGERGAYTVIVVQGNERMLFPNIPFYSPRGRYPDALWYSPTFILGGSTAAGAGMEAWLDNVKLEVVGSRRAWEK